MFRIICKYSTTFFRYISSTWQVSTLNIKYLMTIIIIKRYSPLPPYILWIKLCLPLFSFNHIIQVSAGPELYSLFPIKVFFLHFSWIHLSDFLLLCWSLCGFFPLSEKKKGKLRGVCHFPVESSDGRRRKTNDIWMVKGNYPFKWKAE